MKFVYTLSILLFFPILLRGQSPTFSPIGTKWGFSYFYFSGSGSLIKEAVSDTVIRGRTCRKFINTDIGYNCAGPSCLPFKRTFVSFIAQSQDSIFLYQPRDSTFRFMYHFHSQVGDTMRPLLYANPDLKYVCVRVVDTLFGGMTLKKRLFSQTCPPFSRTNYVTLLEKVGALNSPEGLYNTCLSDDTYYGMCSFQSENIYFQGTNCITSTRETTFSVAVKISPNPTSSFLNIESNHPFLRYKIIDMQGKVHVLRPYTEGVPIGVSQWRILILK